MLGLAARLAGALALTLATGAAVVFLLADQVFPGGAPDPAVAVRAGAVLTAAIAALAAVPAFLLAGGRPSVQRRAGGEGRVDRLTGLLDERELFAELERATALATRGGRPVAIAVLDLDDFELVNHTRGRDHGDRVLRAVADTLVAEARTADRCFRTGGDDFAVLLADTDLVGAVTAVERIVARFSEMRMGASFTVGLAAARGADEDFDALIEAARDALAEARVRGDVIATAPEQGRGSAPSGLARRRALQELLTTGNIGVAFQPILDLAGDTPLGYEALARPDASGPFANAGEAFETAERLGRGDELDTLCRRAALAASRDIPAWALLFVNVSPQSFQRRALTPEHLADAVRFAGREPESVVLEITERADVSLDVVAAKARALADLGFRIALDDTGAGNAGLGMLRALPLDFVKVDRLVVAQARGSRSARAVLAAILAFAEHRGVDVIVEGIEDAETLAFVRHELPSGAVRGVQGHLLGRPSTVVPGLGRSWSSAQLPITLEDDQPQAV